ncbi:hypothetical protein [Polluticoccus soli]|uniref:hypothetical protein n=1 Tax=Polluticoccus soli TaxID=3034150 RepID=UPI0023E2111C|nr:hypothetical protein [Flavipsychrobacter sp. JY13-12]
MKKPHLKCPGCSGSNFQLHEISIANPQTKEEAETSSAIVVCGDCSAIVGVLSPPYPPAKHLGITIVPVVHAPYQEGAYGEESC